MTAPAPTTAPEAPASGADRGEREKLYRHPSDVARLVFAGVILGLLLLLTELETARVRSFTLDVLDLFDDMPAAIGDGLVGLVQFAATLAPVVIVAILVWRRRFVELSILGLAALLAAVMMALLSNVVDAAIPLDELGYERVNSWFIGSQYPSSTYLAAMTAVLVAASPSITKSWRVLGWIFIAAVMLARILSATEVPIRNVMVLAVGAVAGSAALVVFGAPRRRIDVATVADALRHGGLPIAEVGPLDVRNELPTYSARTEAGGQLFVKVVGRDQRDQNLLLRAWRALTTKGLSSTTTIVSPRRTVEHEALVAGVFGTEVSTPQPVAIAQTPDEAAVLATTWVAGRRVCDLTAGTDDRADEADVTDALLDDQWSQVGKLQQRRWAHRCLNTSNLIAASGEGGDDGEHVVIVDLRRADLEASDEVLGADVAELLASLATQIGAERAVASAVRNLPHDELERAVPLLQSRVLSPRTREALDDLDDDLLADVRDRVADAVGIDKVELAPVQRITIGGIVSLVGSIVLLTYVFNLATNWDDTWDAFSRADLTFAIPIVFLMISTYFSGALSLLGASPVNLAYLRTVAVMFGQSYLNRFTPANAGGMAMRVRYLQLNGLDTAVAAASIGLTSAASGIAQGLMIVGFLVWGGSSDRLSDFEFPDMGTIVLIILGLGLVVMLLLMSTWGRTTVLPWVRSGMTKIKTEVAELARNPAKMAQLLGGAILGKLANIIAFWASTLAFGVDISFPKAGALYMVATTIGSAVPTPGGVGGVEAALTAALISYGVDNATAAAVVLFFRTLTFWLPTVPGYGFMRYTQAKGIV